jgi:hypothetical protein
MTEIQFKRLKEAYKLKKYGNLQTWEELYNYQRCCGNIKQIKEIGEWAKKYNKNKFDVKLPLKLNA